MSLLILENISKTYQNQCVLDDVSLRVERGERLALVGPNGCGKTTLINMLLGKDRDFAGYLRLGEWVKYSYMGQEVVFENDDLTLLQLIKARKDMSERAARDHLARFQFYGEDAEKPVRVLSGGERVRLYLACVMLEDADCLILDEPTNHLDMATRDAVEAALRQFRGTVLAVTHDRYFLTHCVNKILEVENGKIVTYEGNYEHYRQLKYGAETEAAAPPDPGPRRVRSKYQRKNRRAETAAPAADRQEIEARIIELEDRLKHLVSSFGAATPPEKYREYAALQKEVEQLYGEWK